MKSVKALSIKYIFTDKAIDIKTIPDKVKKYYEDNARGHLSIVMNTISMRVPFNSSEYKDAIKYVNGKMPAGYDVYLHFCNPKTSHTGGKNVITWASSTNAIHEFGHALGFAHANSLLSGKKEGSKDPFDQMTIYVPYPSTNAPHRFLMKWFLPGEYVKVDTVGSSTYTIGMLKNFNDRTSVKVIDIGKYFLSYGVKKDVNYVAVHTLEGKATYIIGMFKAEAGKSYTIDDLSITVKKPSDKDKTVTMDVSIGALATERSVDDSVDCDCEDCDLEEHDDDHPVEEE
jgi:hypothetical protein